MEKETTDEQKDFIRGKSERPTDQGTGVTPSTFGDLDRTGGIRYPWRRVPGGRWTERKKMPRFRASLFAVVVVSFLVVPVLRDCDKLSFAGVELAVQEMARKVKEKTITLPELSGAVFTVSNGGVYGSLLSTPILNPPQSGILGMHGIKKRPVVVDDQIVARPMMYLALSYDHRLIDGREAVTFLRRIVECIEDPERMMLEM